MGSNRTVHVMRASVLFVGMIMSTMAYSTTHVANAYHEPIFVKVDTERAHVESISAFAHLGVGGKFSAGGGYSLQQVWNKFIEVGFAKIPPQDFLGFSPQGGKTVYVTIWTRDQGFIWNNVPQREDISFIVKGNGAVKRAKYGSIWRDEL